MLKHLLFGTVCMLSLISTSLTAQQTAFADFSLVFKRFELGPILESGTDNQPGKAVTFNTTGPTNAISLNKRGNLISFDVAGTYSVTFIATAFRFNPISLGLVLDGTIISDSISGNFGDSNTGIMVTGQSIITVKKNSTLSLNNMSEGTIQLTSQAGSSSNGKRSVAASIRIVQLK